jgi:hypothetical protein
MYPLIVLFFNITLLRKGPQDVPASVWVIRLVLPAYIAINILILLLSEESATAFLQIAVDFLMMVAFIWPLLYFSAKTARFSQTLCAFLGTDAVISFFAIPAVSALSAQPSGFAIFMMFILMIWHWLVSGHILRHALDKPLFFGLGLALLYKLILSQVMALLFPVISTQT